MANNYKSPNTYPPPSSRYPSGGKKVANTDCPRWRYAEEEESRLKLKLDASLAPSAVHPKNPQYPNYGAGGGGGSLAHPSRLSHSPSTWDAIIGDDVTQLFSR